MELQQIHAAYQREEDRLLLRISYRETNADLQEIRAWITRHLLKTLWPGITTAMEMQVALDQPSAAHAKAEIVGMQHEASLAAMRSAGGFDKPFSAEIDQFPFGKQAILLTQAHIHVEANQGLRIKFVSAHSGHFELCFNATTLHALCKILQDAIANADWGIELRLNGPGTQTTVAPHLLN